MKYKDYNHEKENVFDAVSISADTMSKFSHEIITSFAEFTSNSQRIEYIEKLLTEKPEFYARPFSVMLYMHMIDLMKAVKKMEKHLDIFDV